MRMFNSCFEPSDAVRTTGLTRLQLVSEHACGPGGRCWDARDGVSGRALSRQLGEKTGPIDKARGRNAKDLAKPADRPRLRFGHVELMMSDPVLGAERHAEDLAQRAPAMVVVAERWISIVIAAFLVCSPFGACRRGRKTWTGIAA